MEKKDNIVMIILIIAIIVVAIGLGIFCWNIMNTENDDKEENTNSNNNLYEQKEQIKQIEQIEQEESYEINTEKDEKRTIDMSNYYISSEYGNVSKIYNAMLKKLGTKTFIRSRYWQEGSNYTKENCIDLKNMVSYEESKTEYKGNMYDLKEYIIYKIGKETIYKYVGYLDNWKKDIFEDSNMFKDNGYFLNIWLQFETYKSDNWKFSYENNVTKNDKLCCKITAEKSSEDDSNQKEILYLYIEKETLDLIATENIWYSNYNPNGAKYGYDFEYTDESLEIPEEVLQTAEKDY